jgi:hypothetical protein
MPARTKKSKMTEKEWERFGMKMAKKWSDPKIWKCGVKERVHGHMCGSAIYGLGFIGALVYYLTTAPSFWEAVVGFFKSLVWPAFLVYGALKSLGL